jgi:hypothetical protein
VLYETTIRRELTIQAGRAPVWAALVDLPAYADWNPYIRRAKGPIRPGARLTVTIRPPGTWGRTSHPVVVVVDPSRELRWRGVVGHPLLLEAEHAFRIEPLAEGAVSFVQEEHFRGLLVPLFRHRLTVLVPRGFEAMNEALRELVEGRPGESSGT